MTNFSPSRVCKRGLPVSRPLAAAVSAALLFSFPALAAETKPDASALVAAARINATARPVKLEGQLRSGPDSLPFVLEVLPGVVRYTFSGASRALELHLGENRGTLHESERGKLSAADPDKEIAPFGLAQGELALEFLYWPNPVVEREENVKTRDCFLVRLESPTRRAQYSVVFAWIDKGSGALMRIEGHDWKGRLVRRFEVISGQKINDGWLLKQMRIQALDPETGKTTRRLYLEILGEAGV